MRAYSLVTVLLVSVAHASVLDTLGEVLQVNTIREAFGGGSAYEYAPYTVVAVNHEDDAPNKYEERMYPAAKWVCADEVGPSGAATGLFMELFGYISGSNSRQEEIKMTVPVTVERTPTITDDRFTMSMCFFLGNDHQTDPPTPTNSNLYIQDRPQITIYTREFGGWPGESFYTRERREFEALLSRDGKTYQPRREFRVSYQSPMRLFNRRNELWMVKA